MRYLLMFVAAVVGGGLAYAQDAQDPAGVTESAQARDEYAKKELAKKWLKYFTGDWSVTATRRESGKSDDPRAFKRSAKTVADELALITEEVAGDGNGFGGSLTGWDPSKRSLVVLAFYGNGIIARIEYSTISDDKLSGKTLGHGPGGAPLKGTMTIRKLDDNRYEGAQEITRLDGTTFEWKTECVRGRHP